MRIAKLPARRLMMAQADALLDHVKLRVLKPGLHEFTIGDMTGPRALVAHSILDRHDLAPNSVDELRNEARDFWPIHPIEAVALSTKAK